MQLNVKRLAAQPIWLFLPIAAMVTTDSRIAYGATFLVEPGDTTLQWAMQQAAPGDSLVLLPGHFVLRQAIAVIAGLTITSRDGAVATVVEHYRLSPGRNIFEILDAAPPPTIEGITIAHGWDFGGRSGGGIYIQNSSPTIRNNLFVANVTGGIEGGGGRGGAIGVDGGCPIIEHNTIVSTFCDFGAIDLYQCTARVQFNVICYTGIDTTGSSGMGISCQSSAAAIVDHNLLWKNYYENIDSWCLTDATIDANLVADPRFCNVVLDPSDPVLGDWRVAADSPLAPGGPAASWGAPLGSCAGTSAAVRTTWGKVKSLYRN